MLMCRGMRELGCVLPRIPMTESWQQKIRCRSIEGTDRCLQFMRQLDVEYCKYVGGCISVRRYNGRVSLRS